MSNDMTYYQQRVATERDRAVDAPTTRIAKVHLQLAALYQGVIDQMASGEPSAPDRALPLRIVPQESSGISA